MINRMLTPLVSEIKSFNILKATHQLLPNNIPFYILNTGTADLVKIECMFAAGNWYQQSSLTAFAVNNLLVEGTLKYTSVQIAESSEYYGAYLGYNVDKDNAYVSLFCMRKYLADVLPFMESIVKEASFPEHELEHFKKKHKHQYLVEQTKGKSVARMVHGRMLFGNAHPYGYRILEKDFDALNRNDITSFYRKFYSSSNCKIIASGIVEDAEIKLIEKHLGTGIWNGSNVTRPPLIFPVVTEPVKKVYIEKPEAVQNAIRTGKVLINKFHPDYAAMTLVNCILGGYFGSRLMKTIREEKGYTYGINSLFVTFTHAGYLSIISELGKEVTATGLKDIYAEIEKLRTIPVPADELERVKNYMLGEMVRMFDGTFAQAESLVSLLEYDMDYSYYEQLIDSIKTTNSQTIVEMAYKHLDPTTFSEVVVGKMD